MKKFFCSITLAIVFGIGCTSMKAEELTATVTVGEFSLNMPANWLVVDKISPEFQGILLTTKDQRGSLSVQRRSVDIEKSLSKVDAMIVKGISRKQITVFANLHGSGIRKTGKNADENVLEYVFFYPKTGSNLDQYVLAGIFLAPDTELLSQSDRILQSLKEVKSIKSRE